jgi:hypothetical protein
VQTNFRAAAFLAGGGEFRDVFFPGLPELWWQPERGPEPEQQFTVEPGAQVVDAASLGQDRLVHTGPACGPTQVIVGMAGPVEVRGNVITPRVGPFSAVSVSAKTYGFRSPYGR